MMKLFPKKSKNNLQEDSKENYNNKPIRNKSLYNTKNKLKTSKNNNNLTGEKKIKFKNLLSFNINMDQNLGNKSPVIPINKNSRLRKKYLLFNKDKNNVIIMVLF